VDLFVVRGAHADGVSAARITAFVYELSVLLSDCLRAIAEVLASTALIGIVRAPRDDFFVCPE
jgi:hypothetical protein